MSGSLNSLRGSGQLFKSGLVSRSHVLNLLTKRSRVGIILDLDDRLDLDFLATFGISLDLDLAGRFTLDLCTGVLVWRSSLSCGWLRKTLFAAL